MSNLEIKNLCAKIGEKVLLNDVNLELNSGKFYALIGPNGAGKTTILRSLSRNIETTGKISLDGINLRDLSIEELSKIVAYMTQFSRESNLSVFEVLALGRRVFSGLFLSDLDHAKIKNIVEKFSLQDFLSVKISSLSGGQRQKVMLASCLLQEPRILLLDEPISQLDPKNQYETLEIIKKQTMSLDLVTIVVLHDIQHALHYADEIIMLKNGEILSKKVASEVNSQDLVELFDVSLCIFETKAHKFVYFEHEHGKN